MNPAAIARGEAVRRALLAIARRCLATGSPMPPRHRLSAALGVGRVGLWRHQAKLVAEGALVLDRKRQHSRIYIKEVRS